MAAPGSSLMMALLGTSADEFYQIPEDKVRLLMSSLYQAYGQGEDVQTRIARALARCQKDPKESVEILRALHTDLQKLLRENCVTLGIPLKPLVEAQDAERR
jgi:hypothetical protein